MQNETDTLTEILSLARKLNTILENIHPEAHFLEFLAQLGNFVFQSKSSTTYGH